MEKIDKIDARLAKPLHTTRLSRAHFLCHYIPRDNTRLSRAHFLFFVYNMAPVRNTGGTRSSRTRIRNINSRPSNDAAASSSLGLSNISARKKHDALVHNIQYAGKPSF